MGNVANTYSKTPTSAGKECFVSTAASASFQRHIRGYSLQGYFATSKVEDSFCGRTMCQGERLLGFGFGVGDDPDAPVGLNVEGYDIACVQFGAPHFGYLEYFYHLAAHGLDTQPQVGITHGP